MCEANFTRKDLENIIKELIGKNELPFQIQRQIRDYTTQRGWSFKGIARALCFVVEQRNYDILKNYEQYGIAIITANKDEPYYAAQRFYDALKAEREAAERKQQEIINSDSKDKVVISCGTGDSKRKIKKKTIDISTL